MQFNQPTWLSAVDPAKREAFERAMNVSGEGSTLLQTFINRVVQQLTVREFGMQAVLDRKPGSGNAAYVNRRAGLTGGSAGDWVADTATITEGTGTYSQATFTYRTLATQGKISRKLQATGRSYGDLLALEISSKAEDFANSLESGLLIGDNGADSDQINGLLTLVSGVGANAVTCVTTAAAGGSLTTAVLDQAIDKVKGSANRGDLVIVGSFAGIRQVNSILQSQQRWVDTTEVAAGFRVRTYDGIPLVVSTAMPDALDATAATTNLKAFSGGSTTALAVINKRYMYIEELTPTTVMPLAKASSQYDEFDMYWDGALVQANTLGAGIITGIKP